MALTIQNQIQSQVVSGTKRYYYLYEPLPIIITESDLAARNVTMNINLVDSSDSSTVVETLDAYAIFDLNPGQGLHVDLMRIIQQAHDARLFEFGTIDNIVNGPNAVVSKYIYEFEIFSDSDTPNTAVLRIVPIVGGRNYAEFTPLSGTSFPIDGYAKFGLDLSTRWKDYPIVTTTLQNNLSNNLTPTITKITNTTGKHPCGGMVIWKSRLGGWMYWGFDIKTEKPASRYTGNIEVGMFDVKRFEVNTNIFVPTDYTGLDFTNTVNLKSLSLTTDELFAVSGIAQSPAVYYMPNPDGKLELMRLSSATVPLSNQSNGGDFTVALKSISRTDFKIR